MSVPMQSSPSPASPTATCIHRWRVGRPSNGICAAVCAHCGSTRDYPAAVTPARGGTAIAVSGRT
jgi:hypothetical protein